MLYNYLVIAFRYLKKQKLYTLINITGLGIGMACCALIILFVTDEFSYDTFHNDADQVYRVTEEVLNDGSKAYTANTYSAMAPALRNDFEEIETAARLYKVSALFSYGDAKRFREEEFFYTDSTFFDIFSFPVIQGDIDGALTAPFSMVMTRRMAEKYFGNENPVGKTIRIDSQNDYTITAVLEDIPLNSHFKFDFLASIETMRSDPSTSWMLSARNWYYPPMHVYLKLAKGESAEELEARLPDFVEKYLGPGERKQRVLKLQQLTEIYTTSNLDNELAVNGNKTFNYILLIAAGLILVVACVNFVNLSTSQSLNRIKEVGMRKALGAYKAQLIKQFLFESILLSWIAVIVACLIIIVALPAFDGLVSKQLVLSVMEYLQLFVVMMIISTIIGALAGYYPAFYLSTFEPASVLKGTFKIQGSPMLLRKALVVFQFLVSAGLIITTLIIHNQLDYMMNKDLGFNKEQVLVLPLHTTSDANNAALLKNELLNHSGIIRAATSDNVPGGGRMDDYNVLPEGKDPNEALFFYFMAVDHDFIETMDISMAEGRFFNRDISSDSGAFIVNREALRRMQWDNPIDKALDVGTLNQNGDFNSIIQAPAKIIGVIEDFHYESLHKNVRPIVISVAVNQNKKFLSLRIQAADVSEVIASVKNTWEGINPNSPFEFFFLDDRYNQQYLAEEQSSRVFLTFSFLAIFIASMGLFALASFSAKQKTREIGIRKVMGASIGNIIMLQSKEFAILTLIAFLIAIPITYYGLDNWLNNFAFRIDIGIFTYVIAAIIAIGIAQCTVSYHSIKASRVNPVDSIRSE